MFVLHQHKYEKEYEVQKVSLFSFFREIEPTNQRLSFP